MLKYQICVCVSYEAVHVAHKFIYSHSNIMRALGNAEEYGNLLTDELGELEQLHGNL